MADILVRFIAFVLGIVVFVWIIISSFLSRSKQDEPQDVVCVGILYYDLDRGGMISFLCRTEFAECRQRTCKVDRYIFEVKEVITDPDKMQKCKEYAAEYLSSYALRNFDKCKRIYKCF